MGLAERLNVRHRWEKRDRPQVEYAHGLVRPQDPYRPEDHGEAHRAWLALYDPQGTWRKDWGYQTPEDRGEAPQKAAQGQGSAFGTMSPPFSPPAWIRDANATERVRQQAEAMADEGLHLHVKVDGYVLDSLVTLSARWDCSLAEALRSVLHKGCADWLLIPPPVVGR